MTFLHLQHEKNSIEIDIFQVRANTQHGCCYVLFEAFVSIHYIKVCGLLKTCNIKILATKNHPKANYFNRINQCVR